MARSCGRPVLVAAVAAVAFLAHGAGPAEAQGRIVFINNNQPGIGLNDPTPVAPVGGNPGTTLGAQRTNVLRRAGDIWTDALRPRVDVAVLALFVALGAGVNGSAGPTVVWRDFPSAEMPMTWYPSALANHLSGVDLGPCPSPPSLFCFDISATFSTAVDFYLGFDNAAGPGQVDLLAVVLHELGHGLGFANYVNEATGQFLSGNPDVFSHYTLDVTTGQPWTAMTAAERVASARNVRKVVWSGVNVRKALPSVLQPGEPAVNVLAPALLGALPVGEATFGAPLAAPGVTGDVALGTYLDALGATASDGCEPITSDVRGKIALIDRGVCGFTVQVRHAQDAGAIAALIADNVQQSPPPALTGVDPEIEISSGRISLSDANALKANLPGGVRVTLGIDLSVLAGADRVRGDMMLAALDPVIAAQSISHFEPVARPSQLMGAFGPPVGATSALAPPDDLTLSLMTDIGWFSDHDGVPDGRDDCIGSDARATVFVRGCDSGVSNPLQPDGCSIADVLGRCDGGDGYVGCIVQATRQLRADGLIDERNVGAIMRCAGQSH